MACAGRGGGQAGGVLQEFTKVKQEVGNRRRRWFQGSGLDLIVWLDEPNTPEGFQLCYHDAWRREHALTWRRAVGFTHARVDGGDERPDKDLTPILVTGGTVPWTLLRGEFAARSADLEPALRAFITQRLTEGGD